MEPPSSNRHGALQRPPHAHPASAGPVCVKRTQTQTALLFLCECELSAWTVQRPGSGGQRRISASRRLQPEVPPTRGASNERCLQPEVPPTRGASKHGLPSPRACRNRLPAVIVSGTAAVQRGVDGHGFVCGRKWRRGGPAGMVGRARRSGHAVCVADIVVVVVVVVVHVRRASGLPASRSFPCIRNPTAGERSCAQTGAGEMPRGPGGTHRCRLLQRRARGCLPLCVLLAEQLHAAVVAVYAFAKEPERGRRNLGAGRGGVPAPATSATSIPRRLGAARTRARTCGTLSSSAMVANSASRTSTRMSSSSNCSVLGSVA